MVKSASTSLGDQRLSSPNSVSSVQSPNMRGSVAGLTRAQRRRAVRENRHHKLIDPTEGSRKEPLLGTLVSILTEPFRVPVLALLDRIGPQWDATFTDAGGTTLKTMRLRARSVERAKRRAGDARPDHTRTFQVHPYCEVA
jgi:hypothetical protein